jgi:hypothetical protein
LLFSFVQAAEESKKEKGVSEKLLPIKQVLTALRVLIF